MKSSSKLLDGLYYPFSRCIEIPSMKQLLLVFDRVVFLDPVEDEEWRAQLYRDIEAAGGGEFRKYREVHEVMPTLIEEDAIHHISPIDQNPDGLAAATAAALSDLLDENWQKAASAPQQSGLPYQSLIDGTPVWQAFLPKMPVGYVEALQSDSMLSRHLLIEADENRAWTLSYSAGCAASINLHLAAAAENNLAPVTDSALHHKLLLMKLLRSTDNENRERPFDHGTTSLLTQKVATSVLSRVLPEQSLEALSFDELLKFREKSRDLRHQFVAELESSIKLITRAPTPDDVLHAAHEVEHSLSTQVREYQAEFNGLRDSIWPSLAGSANLTLATGGVAALSMSYIGGAGHALSASIVAASLATLKSALDVLGAQKKLSSTVSPAVSYLSTVSKTFG